MKSHIIFNILIIFTFLGILGCQDKTTNESQIKSEESDTASITKIKWLAHWYGEGKKETLLREIAREFCLVNQNIEIELEFPHQMLKIGPTESAYLQTIDTIVKMVKQNAWPYDLMLCDAYRYQAVADSLKDQEWGKKYLVNFLDQEWFIRAHKIGIFDNDRYTKTFAGIAPGAYIEGVWNMLYVSSEIEKKLGIKVKTLDMNLNDFTSYAKAVDQYNQSNPAKITFLSTPHESGLTPFFNQLVLSALGKDSASNSQEAIVALNLTYKALEKLVPYKPIQQFVKYENERTLYHNKILFIQYPSWINLLWQKSNPEGEKMMHPCEIPSLENKQAKLYSGRYTSVFVVPKNAKNREAAESLMKFMSSEITADKWILYSKSPTGLKNRISYSDFGNDEYTLFSKHIKEKYNDKLDEVNLEYLLFKSKLKVDFQVGKLLKGEISADEALKSVLKQIDNK